MVMDHIGPSIYPVNSAKLSDSSMEPLLVGSDRSIRGAASDRGLGLRGAVGENRRVLERGQHVMARATRMRWMGTGKPLRTPHGQPIFT